MVKLAVKTNGGDTGGDTGGETGGGYDGPYWPFPQIDHSDITNHVTAEVSAASGTMYSLDEVFDNTTVNGIDTSLGGFADNIVDAGLGDDYIIGGNGGNTVDGGDGFDHFIATTAPLETVRDSDDNIIDRNGVNIDLSSSQVTYLGATPTSVDKIENIEYFLGTTADDKFVGAARYESEHSLQVFAPSGGRDEIFGAEFEQDLINGIDYDATTAVDYNAVQGGQGAVFILAGNENIVDGEVSYAVDGGSNIGDNTGSDWNNWLPAAEWVLNQGSETGYISTTSQFAADRVDATVILDTFGYVDLAFDVDYYIGSDTSDLFLGASEDDIFNAAVGADNVMIGGAGEDELIVSDLNESGDDDIDLSSITVKLDADSSTYTHNDLEQVDITDGKFVGESNSSVSGDYYRIDFADVSDIGAFIAENMSSDLAGKYSVTTEYALFIVSNEDLTSLNTAQFMYDAVNGKIDVYGQDISVLEDLSGQLMLAEQTLAVGRYLIEGQTDGGELYSTTIEDVEKVTLTSDEVEYIGTNVLTGTDGDSYDLLIGGQGDLGDMLYVATGQRLDSTTGKEPYEIANSNFVTGEIYYSGQHTDFDRSSNVSTWANSVAAAFTVDNNAQAKILEQ